MTLFDITHHLLNNAYQGVFMLKKINFKTVILWLSIITIVNISTFYLIIHTKEKNYAKFTAQDIRLGHYIIDYLKHNPPLTTNLTNLTNILSSYSTYNVKLSSYLLKKDQLFAKLMLNGVNLQNHHSGMVLFHHDSLLKDLDYPNFFLSFSDIPKSQCPSFTKEFFNLADKVVINHTDIKNPIETSYISDELLKGFCNQENNTISFNFKFNDTKI